MRRPFGFTLLEVLVAFAIATLALAALAQAASGGLRSSAVAARTEQAISRAKSRLAAAALALAPGEQRGDDGGGFAYHVLVRPRETGRAATGSSRPILYDIVVELSWDSDGGTRRVSLATQRLGAAAEAP